MLSGMDWRYPSRLPSNSDCPFTKRSAKQLPFESRSGQPNFLKVAFACGAPVWGGVVFSFKPAAQLFAMGA